MLDSNQPLDRSQKRVEKSMDDQPMTPVVSQQQQMQLQQQSSSKSSSSLPASASQSPAPTADVSQVIMNTASLSRPPSFQQRSPPVVAVSNMNTSSPLAPPGTTFKQHQPIRFGICFFNILCIVTIIK